MRLFRTTGLLSAACLAATTELGTDSHRHAPADTGTKSTLSVFGQSDKIDAFGTAPFQPQLGVGEHARPVNMAPEGEHAGLDHAQGKTFASVNESAREMVGTSYITKRGVEGVATDQAIRTDDKIKTQV